MPAEEPAVEPGRSPRMAAVIGLDPASLAVEPPRFEPI
jgi:hypothetical protein